MGATAQVPLDLLSNMALALIWAGGAAVLGLIVYVFQGLKNKVDDKVDKAEYQHLVEVVEKLDTDMREGYETDKRVEIQLIEIKSQLARMVSHLDSESRTRAIAIERLDTQWIGEIRALRHSLTSYGRRRSDPQETIPPT